MTLRIATFNVNSVRSRMAVLQRWLSQAEVDQLCLQETKAPDDAFPRADFQDLGYRAYFRGEKSYNGVAILSRREPDEVLYGFDDGLEPDAGTRLIRARFGDLWVCNSYVPQGKALDHPDYQYKKDFLRRMGQLAQRHREDPFLWLGDLNVAPTPLDVTNPKNKADHVCFAQELRDHFAAISQPLLVDLLRKFHPQEALYSFFDYRVKGALERNIGWRIDHMLATKSLADRCLRCWIDTEPRGWEKSSDHTPVLADFDL